MTDWPFEKLREDYLRWHPAQVETGDIDPVYPVLRYLADAWDLDVEERAWLVFCHVVWYHPGSTLAGFRAVPDVSAMPTTADGLHNAGLLELPCETERRGHRPKQPLINHLLGLRETFLDGGCWEWAQRAIADAETPEEGWLQLNDALTTLVGNGRWAAYKTAEMLEKVCGLPVKAADAGHRFSSGPRKGLELLEPHCPADNRPDTIGTLDLMTSLWADQLGEPDVALVETSLCDFNSLVRGRYYLGHDIDSMQAAWLNPKVAGQVPTEAWDARADTFAHEFLGEFHGWLGVRKELNPVYKKTGELIHVH